MKKMMICPDCGEKKEIVEEVVVGDIIECANCGCEVEVLSLEPFEYRELVEEK